MFSSFYIYSIHLLYFIYCFIWLISTTCLIYKSDALSKNGTYIPNPALLSSSQPESSTWGSKISAGDLRDPSFWTITLLYPCMYSILVDVSVKLFALLALRLTNFENHRTQTTFVNRLVLKVS